MIKYPFYVYLHTNGELITKPTGTVDAMGMGALEYFDSPFVVDWWLIRNEAELKDLKQEVMALKRSM